MPIFSFFKKLKYLDLPLISSAMLLLFAGMSSIYSASLSSENLMAFWKQLLFLSIGVALFLFFSFFDYHTLTKANRVFYILLALSLTYLLFFGADIRGGKRWLDLGFTQIQIAEFAKIIILLGLSRLLYIKRGLINSWMILAWSLAYAALPAFLVLMEPDFGSGMIIMGIWLCLVIISPIKKKHLLIIFLCFALAGGLAWKYFLKDFQKDRVKVFINPELDPRGRGYNVKQATIAVGSGQIWGRGLAKGMQTQNKFLPESKTDFIFAATAEEFGFVGSSVIVILYMYLLWRLIKIFKNSKDDLGMYIAAGTFFYIFLHVVINLGMNIGILPVTGIPLPFFSAGGSSLISVLIALGLAQNVNLQSKMLRF